MIIPPKNRVSKCVMQMGCLTWYLLQGKLYQNQEKTWLLEPLSLFFMGPGKSNPGRIKANPFSNDWSRSWHLFQQKNTSWLIWYLAQSALELVKPYRRWVKLTISRYPPLQNAPFLRLTQGFIWSSLQNIQSNLQWMPFEGIARLFWRVNYSKCLSNVLAMESVQQ